MAKVKVYRARRWDAAAQDFFISTRMFTKEWIATSRMLQAIPETEAEIDASQLVPGEGWTKSNFDPQGSN
jgi:hypothetical protein